MNMPRTLPDAAAAAAWLRARVAHGGALQSDSRLVHAGDVFLAWPGRVHDARAHVIAALGAGAAACLVEAEGAAAYPWANDGRVAALRALKANAGEVASRFNGNPGAALSVIAGTGTNGKTSTSWWTAEALSHLGVRAAVAGTLGIGEPPRLEASGLTTPDALALHAALRRLADNGVRAVAIEASSIGIEEGRLAALPIRVATFTNFTRDHLDYHGTMQRYWEAKRKLFDWPGLQVAVVNVDDAKGAELAAELGSSAGGPGLDVWTVSMKPGVAARLRAGPIGYAAGGLSFEVLEEEDPEGGDRGRVQRATLDTALVGDFNVSNLLVVLGALRALGHPLAAAVGALATVTPVPGRLQRISGAGIDVIVDYAHTPDALEKVLAALRPLAALRGTALWCVFGCGGDRDATKRPLMGRIAAIGADHVVITSDNPRSEVPTAILADIRAGITADISPGSDVAMIEDRREAIRHAVTRAAAGDVVLLAGKGHEDYQEIAGVRRPFSDTEEAEAALAQRAARASSVANAASTTQGAAA
jgi:UDP-N-acetylmuramoyl-L-alanyl-D-glutamate--2,6-diaminopimelate ligase